QIWTGFVYGGPFTPRRINQGLVEHLERGGFRRLDEAVGSGL
ncbi:MAG: dihydroorotate dehydrogenase (quinone), partial [Gemmatimonadota bacterium]|nr:dihydroorotate dehydrogenase (quinone) [Gemmatimonadota bacterium]